MASRENQGLHIALIVLIMFSLLLCGLTYYFYSKSETRRVAAEDAQNRANQAQSDLRTANFKVQTLTYMIKDGNKTRKQIADDLANFTGGDVNDPTMAALLKNFQDNMLLYGAPDQESETARNYESLPNFLMARVQDLNKQLADLRRAENELTAQKTQLEQTSADREKKYEDAANQARQELEAERAKFQTDLAEVRSQMDGIASQTAEKDNKINELTAQLQKQRDDSAEKVTELAKTIDDLKNQLAKFKVITFETPDAVVTTVNQRQGIVYLNVGAADNLSLQQTFSVYDKGTTAIMQAEPKGRIEVIDILGEHVASARILEEKVGNIIVPGDLALTPTWDPGHRVHIAITGFVDLTGDGQSDLEMLKALITANGGIVDDVVTPETRYLVAGEAKGTDMGGAMTGPEKDDFNTKIRAAGEIGVDRLSVDKLLSLMGWRADVKSVVLGTGTAAVEAGPEPAAAPEFRPRTPPARGADGAF